MSDVGRVTARLAGDSTNVFFSPGDNDRPDAGFTLGFPEAVGTITNAGQPLSGDDGLQRVRGNHRGGRHRS